MPDELLSGVERMEVAGVGLDALLSWGVAEGVEGGGILGAAVTRNTRSSFFPLGKSTETI